MVKPTFAKLEIDFWVHHGKLGITQSSLCLFHESVAVGLPVLDALNELTNETWPAQRKLTFVKCSRKRALSSLRLLVVPRREDLKVMNIRYDADAATIEMTDIGLRVLIHAITTWLNGGEDFGVSPRRSTLSPKDFGKLDHESCELWFWGPGYTDP